MVEKLEAAHQNDLRKMEELEARADEANEKVARLDMVEKTLLNTQTKVAEFKADIARLREENDRLRERVAELEAEKKTLMEQQRVGNEEGQRREEGAQVTTTSSSAEALAEQPAVSSFQPVTYFLFSKYG